MTRSSSLRRLNDNSLTRAEKAMAEIEANWVAWRSPVTDVSSPDGWRPVDDSGDKPLDVEMTLRKQYRLIADPPLPWWRRVVRRLRGVR